MGLAPSLVQVLGGKLPFVESMPTPANYCSRTEYRCAMSWGNFLREQHNGVSRAKLWVNKTSPAGTVCVIPLCVHPLDKTMHRT